MKRVYWLIPCLALTAFAGYYTHWELKLQRHYRLAADDPYALRDGGEEALFDLAHGRLRVVGLGMPAHWYSEYAEVLRRDYGIERDLIAGCIVTKGICRYAKTYNKIMEAEIAKRHGPRVFDDAAAKAERLYAERHPPLPAEAPVKE